LDLLVEVAFGEPAQTRTERVAQLRERAPSFFARFEPPARDVLEAVLAKYIASETDVVADTELLKVPPLSESGTFLELAQRFGGGSQLRTALAELQRLLYATEELPTTRPNTELRYTTP
jgi:type I restriction enzyme R subunit